MSDNLKQIAEDALLHAAHLIHLGQDVQADVAIDLADRILRVAGRNLTSDSVWMPNSVYRKVRAKDMGVWYSG